MSFWNNSALERYVIIIITTTTTTTAAMLTSTNDEITILLSAFYYTEGRDVTFTDTIHLIDFHACCKFVRSSGNSLAGRHIEECSR